MDKRKVIEAYRRGFLTLQECAQILGVEKTQMTSLLGDMPELGKQRGSLLDGRKATGNM